jgi:hypothetical protein
MKDKILLLDKQFDPKIYGTPETMWWYTGCGTVF